ncbi:MAG: Gfo/Idh/MocA family protein [Phycisphaerales bacterium]
MTIGVGIIGLGFMGRTHLAAFAGARGAEVRALHDPAMRAAASGNLVTGGGAVEALLESLPREVSVEALLARADIDLVSICTPTDSHVPLVRAAIRAGKHVLVEKPTSLDAELIDELAREAEAAGVLAMPAHCMRFWPAWSWMASCIRERRFGRVRHAAFRRLGARPAWSQDFYLDIARSGGALVDLHIHDADFVRFAFGEPSSVHAEGTRMHVRARYSYDGGPVVTAEGGWMDDPSFAFRMEAVIECDDATIDFAIQRSPELLLTTDGATRELVAGSDYPGGSGYDHEVQALIDAIARGDRSAPVTLAEAAATQRLLDREAALLGFADASAS